MKQRIYLPAEYAEILARKAAEARVSPDLYIQTLIAQDHICGGPMATPPPAVSAAAAPANEGIQLSGAWGDLSL
jgi:hypothetical protein